ncbi:MAG: hypothetical protein J6P72_03645 [Firmicutes bacterium]|nr:hypothetical protein [Bacillota bacterium]
MGFLTSRNPNNEPARAEISEEALNDLMLRSYLDRIFDLNETASRFDWTRFFTSDPEDLLYRRQVLSDLLNHPDLVNAISDVCKCLAQISSVQDMPASGEFYAESIREFSVLHLAHATMTKLMNLLDDMKSRNEITSGALIQLGEVIEEKVRTSFTADFDRTFRELAGGLEQLGSMKIRFTLDGEMHTQGAAITHIQKERFVGSLFGHNPIKELRQKEKPWDLSSLKEMKTPAEELIRVQLGANIKAFFQSALKIWQDLAFLYDDLMFYLGALRYIRQMKMLNLPLTYPTPLPASEKSFRAIELYNPILAVFKKAKTVPNDITFQPGGELFILTGINQGGKTTFLRSVGTAQALFQLGWPIPCKEASISPVSGIVTVFSHEENTNLQHGKLGQELKTFRAGLDRMKPDALLLCNEPITGTSPMENLYLSREILSACKLLGYHGIWVTHIYDLASGADEMNKALSGSTISSLTAVALQKQDGVEASFVIKRGKPKFTSYAKEVLRRETGVF